jgi:hypothetical protein
MGEIGGSSSGGFKEAAVRRLELGASVAKVPVRTTRTSCTAGGESCASSARRLLPGQSRAEEGTA